MAWTRKPLLVFLSAFWIIAHVVIGALAAVVIGVGIGLLDQLVAILGSDPRSDIQKMMNVPRQRDELPKGGFMLYETVAGAVFGLIYGIARVVLWLRPSSPNPQPEPSDSDEFQPFIFGLIAGLLGSAITIPVLMLVSGLIWLITGYATLSSMLPIGLVIGSVPGLVICIAGWQMPNKPTELGAAPDRRGT